MSRAGDRNGADPPRLSELLPTLVVELARGLSSEGRADLIPQLEDLVVESRCGCGQSDCATLYVSGGVSPLNNEQKRDRGPHCRDTIAIDAAAGHIAVDTDRYDRISRIEILNMPDINEQIADFRWEK
jgi:hypothetical protein